MQKIPNPAVVLALILNGLLFIIYLILKNNGEKGSFFNGVILSNPIKLYGLAKRTKDKGIRLTYFALVFTIPILTILFAFTAYNQMTEFINPDDCKYHEYVKNSEWNGKVVEKYLDIQDRNSMTLGLKNESGVFKIKEGILSELNNYELIEIGDSISKIKGELIAHLYKSEGKMELKSDFECEK